jgi:hypothetical protein
MVVIAIAIAIAIAVAVAVAVVNGTVIKWRVAILIVERVVAVRCRISTGYERHIVEGRELLLLLLPRIRDDAFLHPFIEFSKCFIGGPNGLSHCHRRGPNFHHVVRIRCVGWRGSS